MDKVAKGMSEAGRKAMGKQPEAEPQGMTGKVKEWTREAGEKVGDAAKATGQKLKDAVH
jgi:hypothetical protein